MVLCFSRTFAVPTGRSHTDLLGRTVTQTITSWWDHGKSRQPASRYSTDEARADRVEDLPGYGKLDSDLYSG